MPLETFTNSEAHLNIKRISGESLERETRVHFDLKNEFSTIERQEMEEALNRLLADCRSGHGDYLFFGTTASKFAQIDRPHLPQLDDKDWNSIKMILEQYGSRNNFYDLIDVFSRFHIIDQTAAPKFAEADWKRVLALVNDLRGDKKWEKLSELLADIVAIDRERLPEITEDDWQGMISVVNNYLRPKVSSNRPILMLANIARVAPERLPYLEAADWSNMKQFFGSVKSKNSPAGLIWYAADFTTISRAEQGLKNSPIQTGNDDEHPLPQTRNF